VTRVALTLEQPSTALFLRFEAYLAVTTNTFQVGGALEVGVHAGSFNAVGFISLDALIQFTPFHFEVEFAAGFRVRWNSLTLAGREDRRHDHRARPDHDHGQLLHRAPVLRHLLERLVHHREAAAVVTAAVSSVTQALQQELTQSDNLAAVGGDDKHAVQQRRGVPLRAVVSPLGALTWTQKRVPFDVLLDRFEGQPLASQQSVVVESPQGLGPAQDWFSPGSYANLSQSRRSIGRRSSDWTRGSFLGSAMTPRRPCTTRSRSSRSGWPKPPITGSSSTSPPSLWKRSLDGRPARRANPRSKVGVTTSISWSGRRRERADDGPEPGRRPSAGPGDGWSGPAGQGPRRYRERVMTPDLDFYGWRRSGSTEPCRVPLSRTAALRGR